MKRYKIKAKPCLTNYGRGLFFYLPRAWVEEKGIAEKEVMVRIPERKIYSCGKVSLYKYYGAVHVRKKYIPKLRMDVESKRLMNIELVTMEE